MTRQPRFLFLAMALVACSSDREAESAGAGGEGAQADPECPTPLRWQLDPVSPSTARGSVTLSPPSGGFDGSLAVSLTPVVAGSAIVYTTDGSLPTPGSARYSAPIPLASTTVIRAATLGPDGRVEEAAAGVYLKVTARAASFTSHLPLAVVYTAEGPFDVESEDYLTGVLLTFEPSPSGRTSLIGPATLGTRLGVKIRGNTSRYFPQKSFSLELWGGDEDTGRNTVLLGMPAGEDFALVAPSEMDRSLIRNPLAYALSRSIGRYAPRTRTVEAFVVETGEDLDLAHYAGVYAAAERVKRGSERVDVQKLEPADLAAPAVSGGYLVEIDHGEGDFFAGGEDFVWIYPNRTALLDPARAPQAAYIKRYIDDFAASLATVSSSDAGPPASYHDYIDVGAFIDHSLLVAYTKNVDGLRLSAFLSKDRNGPLVAGPIWDFDRSMGTRRDDRATLPEEWTRGDGTHPLAYGWYGHLYRDLEFRERYWQRFDRLSCEAVTEANLHAMVDQMTSEIGDAADRHFARWPELEPEGGYAEEIRLLKDWLSRRLSWLEHQHGTPPPEPSQEGTDRPRRR